MEWTCQKQVRRQKRVSFLLALALAKELLAGESHSSWYFWGPAGLDQDCLEPSFAVCITAHLKQMVQALQGHAVSNTQLKSLAFAINIDRFWHSFHYSAAHERQV